MAKKLGFNPFVILTAPPQPTDVIVIGGGSGEGGSNPVPFDFNSWKDSAWTDGYDFSGDGSFDVAEYCAWWSDMMDEYSQFTMELWAEMNPGLEWDDTWI